MRYHQGFFDLLSIPSKKFVRDMFSQNLVKFDKEIVIKHEDGTRCSFKYVSLFIRSDLIIVLTEHFGYFEILRNDEDLTVEEITRKFPLCEVDSEGNCVV